MSKNHSIEKAMQNLTTDELQALLGRDMLTVLRVMGYTNTSKLIREFGGTEISVPVGNMKSYQKQQLIDCMGVEATQKFMRHFRGERLYLARCDKLVRFLRNRSFYNTIEQAVKSGMGKTKAVKAFGKEFGIGERQGYKILSGMNFDELVIKKQVDDRQLGLFDDGF